MTPKAKNAYEKIKRSLEQNTVGLSREDYAEVLENLGSDIECFEDALSEEGDE